ncbi:prolyl oligopeptidase family serine peptidase [Trueperella bialowiezensis]|uniref:Prolyl endopeptidase n=1 Tax=Trueperella bialowiezensis TaxID=312285 RepID=A0A448PF54_9ACTO|nr:prolyl oligopeptidase family serine peptidase [Trueperella bialowiezensis]VEI13546.1 Prolyl endopeptidase precursor [Trueperella bialowiezensis]
MTKKHQKSADPYLHLEELNKKNHKWVTKESERTLAEFGGRGFKRRRKDVAKILAAKDKLVLGSKRGEWIYNFHTDGDNPRGLWRRAKMADYLAKDQEKIGWEVLLDVDRLGKKEGESWVFHGASLLYPSYDRALITLSRGGSDSNVVREFDVAKKRFVKGGFERGESKGSMSWVDDSAVIVSGDFGAGSLTDSGYPRTARLWKRGTKLAKAPVIIEGEASDVIVGATYDPTPGFERLIAYRATDFRSTMMYDVDLAAVRNAEGVVPAEALRPFQLPHSAEVGALRDWALVTLRHDWELDGHVFVAGSVLVLPYEAALAGPRAGDVRVLYKPTDSTAFLDVTATATGLVLTILDNVQTRILFAADPHVAGGGAGGDAGGAASRADGSVAGGVASRADGSVAGGDKWQIVEVTPEAAQFATVSVAAVDPRESEDVWMTISDFLTPPTLYYGTVNQEELRARKLRSAPARFDAEGLEVRQMWAESADGTKVPYFAVGSPKVLDGKRRARVLLDGYGGFEVPRLPSYISTYGKVWLEEGGVYVVANIRGGGEFGPAWHQAALKENRNKAYEDFAAVAADLVDRGITKVSKLAAIGGSNGGLLMGNMYTTYPQLFGAIVCQVPLLDMKRYSHLLAGASWMEEYGNPDTDDWEYMEQYSAYHNVGDGPHPPILLTTSTRDDRVHPGHARKFHALLKDSGFETYLYENTEGGHAGAADIEQQALMTALVFSFLDKKLKK